MMANRMHEGKPGYKEFCAEGPQLNGVESRVGVTRSQLLPAFALALRRLTLFSHELQSSVLVYLVTG